MDCRLTIPNPPPPSSFVGGVGAPASARPHPPSARLHGSPLGAVPARTSVGRNGFLLCSPAVTVRVPVPPQGPGLRARRPWRHGPRSLSADDQETRRGRSSPFPPKR